MIYLLLIVLAPAVASLWILFGRKKAGAAGFAGAVVSLVGSALLYLKVLNGFSASWQFAGLPDMPFVLEMTYLNAALSLVIAGVSALIFLYAVGYMGKQDGKVRFWSSISLFLVAMQVLVFAGDWILFVMAWEILGFCSYVLISTKYWQSATGQAANKAFTINRFADLGLYIGVFMIILGSGSSSIGGASAESIPRLGALTLLFAVMGKSAQVPFQSWLSAAMKGPTPVSALLHSATMVAAGIVLLIKAHPLFSSAALVWVGMVGTITILLTGLTAVYSDDIKQMLAASTSSQLGFMVMAIGAGYPGAALAHLVAHAFMKSSLFLGAGIYQHGAGSTSFDQLAGAGKKLKITFVGFVVAGVALAGIPPMVGYFSKDAVLAAGYNSPLNEWYFVAAIGGALLTAVYMSRAMGMLWKGEAEEIKIPAGIRWMQFGFVLMVLLVLTGGLFVHPLVEMADFSWPKAKVAKISGLIAALAGLVGGWLMSAKRADHPVTEFIRDNYALAGGFQILIVQPVLKFAIICRKLDESIHQVVLKVGRGVLSFSSLPQSSDQHIHHGVHGVGRLGLWLSKWSERADEQGINGIIAALTDWVQKLGEYGRKTQSGLVHRELMWSVWGMFVFLMLMILTLM